MSPNDFLCALLALLALAALTHPAGRASLARALTNER